MKRTLTTFCLVILLAFASQTNRASATIHTVDVRNNVFAPNQFSCDVGDTVRFVWVQGTHNVTWQSQPAGSALTNASITSSNVQQDYVITHEGNYTYTCTFHSGMNGSFTAFAVQARPEAQTAPVLRLFPNPAREAVVLEATIHEASLGSAQLLNAQGQLIAEQAFGWVASGPYRTLLPLSQHALPAGVYFLRLQVGSALRTQRLVIE